MLRNGIVAMLAALALVNACAKPQRADMPWSGASPDPTVVNVLPVRFAPDSGATEAVQNECDPQHRLPEWIAHYTPVPMVLAENPDHGTRVLDMTITSIFAPGGGTWTGPKQVKVHGDLVQQGEVVASFDVQRTTVSGGWASGGGTCEVLDYVSQAIAKDVRPWLAQPTQNARLGELD